MLAGKPLFIGSDSFDVASQVAASRESMLTGKEEFALTLGDLYYRLAIAATPRQTGVVVVDSRSPGCSKWLDTETGQVEAITAWVTAAFAAQAGGYSAATFEPFSYGKATGTSWQIRDDAGNEYVGTILDAANVSGIAGTRFGAIASAFQPKTTVRDVQSLIASIESGLEKSTLPAQAWCLVVNQRTQKGKLFVCSLGESTLPNLLASGGPDGSLVDFFVWSAVLEPL